MKYALKVFYAQTYLNSSRKHSEDSNKSARWIIIFKKKFNAVKKSERYDFLNVLLYKTILRYECY